MEDTAILGAVVSGLVLAAFGGAVLLAARIISPPGRPAGEEAMPTVLVIVGWVLVAGGLTAMSVCLVGFLVSVLALCVLGMLVVRRLQAEQHALLSTLAIAAQRLMPLAPAVEAFAEERGGLTGWRARRLADLLRAGRTLPDALHETPGLISRQAQVSIRAGQECGALAEALRNVAGAHGLGAAVFNQVMGKVLYLGLVLVLALFVVTFMALRIAPEFQMIFADFEADLPALTQAVLAVSYAYGDYFFILGWPLALVVMILAIGFIELVAQYIAGARWSTPAADWLTRRLDTAVILEALALAAERKATFAAAIATLAQWYPRRPMRRRLREALEDLNAGADWCESLARRRLIKPADLAVLQAAQRVGNLPWALREMAESNRRRLAYRLYVLVQILSPLVILAFALLMMILVVSYFLPVVSLIENLRLDLT